MEFTPSNSNMDIYQIPQLNDSSADLLTTQPQFKGDFMEHPQVSSVVDTNKGNWTELNPDAPTFYPLEGRNVLPPEASLQGIGQQDDLFVGLGETSHDPKLSATQHQAYSAHSQASTSHTRGSVLPHPQSPEFPLMETPMYSDLGGLALSGYPDPLANPVGLHPEDCMFAFPQIQPGLYMAGASGHVQPSMYHSSVMYPLRSGGLHPLAPQTSPMMAQGPNVRPCAQAASHQGVAEYTQHDSSTALNSTSFASESCDSLSTHGGRYQLGKGKPGASTGACDQVSGREKFGLHRESGRVQSHESAVSLRDQGGGRQRHDPPKTNLSGRQPRQRVGRGEGPFRQRRQDPSGGRQSADHGHYMYPSKSGSWGSQQRVHGNMSDYQARDSGKREPPSNESQRYSRGGHQNERQASKLKSSSMSSSFVKSSGAEAMSSAAPSKQESVIPDPSLSKAPPQGDAGAQRDPASSLAPSGPTWVDRVKQSHTQTAKPSVNQAAVESSAVTKRAAKPEVPAPMEAKQDSVASASKQPKPSVSSEPAKDHGLSRDPPAPETTSSKGPQEPSPSTESASAASMMSQPVAMFPETVHPSSQQIVSPPFATSSHGQLPPPPMMPYENMFYAGEGLLDQQRPAGGPHPAFQVPVNVTSGVPSPHNVVQFMSLPSGTQPCVPGPQMPPMYQQHNNLMHLPSSQRLVPADAQHFMPVMDVSAWQDSAGMPAISGAEFYKLPPPDGSSMGGLPHGAPRRLDMPPAAPRPSLPFTQVAETSQINSALPRTQTDKQIDNPQLYASKPSLFAQDSHQSVDAMNQAAVQQPLYAKSPSTRRRIPNAPARKEGNLPASTASQGPPNLTHPAAPPSTTPPPVSQPFVVGKYLPMQLPPNTVSFGNLDDHPALLGAPASSAQPQTAPSVVLPFLPASQMSFQPNAVYHQRQDYLSAVTRTDLPKSSSHLPHQPPSELSVSQVTRPFFRQPGTHDAPAPNYVFMDSYVPTAVMQQQASQLAALPADQMFAREHSAGFSASMVPPGEMQPDLSRQHHAPNFVMPGTLPSPIFPSSVGPSSPGQLAPPPAVPKEAPSKDSAQADPAEDQQQPPTTKAQASVPGKDSAALRSSMNFQAVPLQGFDLDQLPVSTTGAQSGPKKPHLPAHEFAEAMAAPLPPLPGAKPGRLPPLGMPKKPSKEPLGPAPRFSITDLTAIKPKINVPEVVPATAEPSAALDPKVMLMRCQESRTYSVQMFCTMYKVMKLLLAQQRSKAKSDQEGAPPPEAGTSDEAKKEDAKASEVFSPPVKEAKGFKEFVSAYAGDHTVDMKASATTTSLAPETPAAQPSSKEAPALSGPASETSPGKPETGLTTLSAFAVLVPDTSASKPVPSSTYQLGHHPFNDHRGSWQPLSRYAASKDQPDDNDSWAGRETDTFFGLARPGGRHPPSRIYTIGDTQGEAGEALSDHDKALKRKLNSILNKLTVKTFSKFYDSLFTIGLQTEEDVLMLNSLIFEKSKTQHDLIPLYVQLCESLNQDYEKLEILSGKYQTMEEQQDALTSKDSGSKKRKTEPYRFILLDACQRAFMALLAPPAVPEDLSPEEQFEHMVLVKKQCKGQITFIAELFMRRMLASRVIFECCKSLLQTETELNLEVLCQLLNHCGHRLIVSREIEDKIPSMKRSVQECLTQPKSELPLRIKFALEDVLKDWDKGFEGAQKEEVKRELKNSAYKNLSDDTDHFTSHDQNPLPHYSSSSSRPDSRQMSGSMRSSGYERSFPGPSNPRHQFRASLTMASSGGLGPNSMVLPPEDDFTTSTSRRRQQHASKGKQAGGFAAGRDSRYGAFPPSSYGAASGGYYPVSKSSSKSYQATEFNVEKEFQMPAKSSSPSMTPPIAKIKGQLGDVDMRTLRRGAEGPSSGMPETGSKASSSTKLVSPSVAASKEPADTSAGSPDAATWLALMLRVYRSVTAPSKIDDGVAQLKAELGNAKSLPVSVQIACVQKLFEFLADAVVNQQNALISFLLRCVETGLISASSVVSALETFVNTEYASVKLDAPNIRRVLVDSLLSQAKDKNLIPDEAVSKLKIQIDKVDQSS